MARSILFFAFVAALCSCSAGSEPSTFKQPTFPEQYPGAWRTDIRGDITQTLAHHQARGCGVYVYKLSAESESEFLVYCSPDGLKDWTSYQVWPEIDEVIGPMRTHPEIPPPAL